jgi:uncharacterized protein (TIGR02231 family)
MKTSGLILSLFVSITLWAQIKTKHIDSKLTQVTLYLSGAELSHVAELSTTPGTTRWLIKNIAPNINPQSIRITAGKDIKVTSISYERNYLNEPQRSKEIKALYDSLDVVRFEREQVQADADVYQSEKQLIQKNNVVGGTANGVNTEELRKMADFYRARMKEINTKLFSLSKSLIKLDEKAAKIQRQINELNEPLNQAEYAVVVDIQANKVSNSSLEIKYLVNDAGWEPFYDIRAIDTNEPIDIEYKAKVYNNTGLDFEKIDLTLSTADPNVSAQRPHLNPWNLNFNTYINREGHLNKMDAQAPAMYGESRAEYADEEPVVTQQQTISNSIDVNELTVNFRIKNQYTLPSDNKIYMADIETYKVPALYSHFAIPKIDPHAFLMAHVTGWEKLNLIEGKANIYYAGTYIGESYINPRFSTDTMDISLGRDTKIMITRIKKEDFGSNSILGAQRKETFTYETTIRNSHKHAIQIEVLDQIPVSQEENIKVVLIESNNIKPETLSGQLKYQFNIEPSAEQKLKLAYSVQYPKDRPVTIRTSRQTQKSARFF